MIYLVRHAHAGSKREWTGHDWLRPLSAAGHRQARGLVARLRHRPIGAIVSSPAVRCRQTVEPLARDRGLDVAVDSRLAVYAGLDQTLALLRDPGMDRSALCTHGEVIGQVLDALREGGALIDPLAHWPKGSIWLLDLAGRRCRATYLPPVDAPQPSHWVRASSR